ncbi:hypothetical protein DENSPDRAFT_826263 [Dentipellis sp. KUC8613]|nr:hypothetical protein DENSPDRAFT_826263 [Dentipellis sp. KUC8613]
MRPFVYAISLLSLLASASAQRILIGAPSNGSSIASNSSLTVEIDEPVTATGAQDVAIVISLAYCAANDTCADVSGRLGSTLYAGPFSPQFPANTSTTPRAYPQQNFTVAVPPGLQPGGKAVLSVTHLSLVGAGPFAFLETANVTLNVADP